MDADCTNPPPGDNDSRMLEDSSSSDSGVDDDDKDDDSDHLSKTNSTAGQGSEEHSSNSSNYVNSSSPASPFRKKKDCKETFVRDEESVKKRSPKKSKTITPDKYGRRTSTRLNPPNPLLNVTTTPIKEAAPIAEDGDGVSL